MVGPKAVAGPNPRAKDAKTSERLGRQKTAFTYPEVRLRDELERRGFIVELHPPELPGRPDIVLRKRRLAIFVHGCFWHGCPKHFTAPQNNRDWWLAKIDQNRSRDRRKAAALRRLGWSVLVVWEHSNVRSAGERIQVHSRKKRKSS